jgi:hypothetical protein
MTDNPTPAPELPADLKARVLLAVQAEPTPTQAARRRQAVVLLTIGAAISLATFVCAGGVRCYERPPLLVFVTAFGWLAATIIALAIAFARGRSPLGRPTTWLLALVVAAPVLLLAWKVAVTLPFGPESMVYWDEKLGFRCLELSLGTGLPLLVALAFARRRSVPVRPGLTGAALGMAAGIAAGSLVDLWCPVGYLPHLLLGHILPLVVLAGLGALLGRRLIRL